MLNCKDTAQLVSKSLDTSLPWWTRMQLKVHVALCKVCKVRCRQIQMIRNAVHACLSQDIREEAAPREFLSEERKKRMQQDLNEAMAEELKDS